jgi:Glycosyltransferase like family
MCYRTPRSDDPHGPTDRGAVSFACCVSDSTILDANLLASPCLGPDSAHEVIALKNCSCAAAGLNVGLERAKHEWVICVHQDVYLPDGWDLQLAEQLKQAERRFGPIGVAGVYGVGEVIPRRLPDGPLMADRIGCVVDRGRLLQDGPGLPARVATLDELLLVVPRDTPLRFDPALGFHLYGADICLQASERGLAVVAIGALCYHNSRSVGLPEAFFPSAEVFARKWAHRLPIATPCVVIDRDRKVYLLGNAGEYSPQGTREDSAGRSTSAQGMQDALLSHRPP